MQKTAINPISAAKGLVSLGRKLVPNSVGRLSQLENSKVYNNPAFRAVTDLAIPGIVGYQTHQKLKENHPELDPAAAYLYSVGLASAASPRDLTNALIKIKSGPGSPAFASQFVKNILPQVGTKALFGGLATVPMAFDISQDLKKSVSKIRETSEQLTATDPQTKLTAAEQIAKALGSSARNIEASGNVLTDELNKFFDFKPDPSDPTGKRRISPVTGALTGGVMGLSQAGANLETLTGKDNPLNRLTSMLADEKSPLSRMANSAEKLTGLAESGKNFLKKQDPAYVGAGLGAAAGIPLIYLLYRALASKPKKKEKQADALSAVSAVDPVASSLSKLPSGRPSNLALYGLPIAAVAARASLGAGLGAGAHYAGNYLVPDPDETAEDKSKNLKRNIIAGAGIGAGSGLLNGIGLYSVLKNMQKNHDIQSAAKQAASRCWSGYEPVPGKTPYSEDSCRPIGSKSKKKEKKAAGCDCDAQKCDSCGTAPCECNSDSDQTLLAKIAAAKLIIKVAGKRGLWDNIHAKRERGEKPAKPGEKDYPDSKSWNATVKAGAVDKLISMLATGRLKQAWEVGDDTGWYSNHPLRYASYLADPPRIPAKHPDYEREFANQLLQRAVKKLPSNQKLHWVDPDAVLGERAWYNPMRYMDGKQIIGEKNYELDGGSDDKNRAEILQQILDNYAGKNMLMSHYPAQYDEDAWEADLNSLARKTAAAAWTRSEGKSESGGLNAKGRASLKAQGHDIKPPVTEDNPTGERAGRKASFCARMSGHKAKNTSAETARDPDSRINKSLRKWKC